MEVEECWMCRKEEHVCEMALPKTQVDYEWLWVCMECYDITDSVSLVTLREAVKKKRKNKEPITYSCNACSRLVNKNQRSVQCIQCED